MSFVSGSNSAFSSSSFFFSSSSSISSSADLLLVADLSGDEELLHGHVVHGGEVLDSVLLATFPAVLAEVLLEVDNILCDHDGILDVGLNPLQALDALLAGVPSAPKSVTDTHSLTDVDCSIHKVVVDNGIQQDFCVEKLARYYIG